MSMKIARIFSFIFVCIITLLGLSGCEEKSIENSKPIVTVLLVGNHANSRSFDIDLEAVIEKTYSSFGNMGIIVVDGNPTLLHDGDSLDILGCYSTEYLKESKHVFKNNSVLWRKDYLHPQIDKITKELENMQSK